MCIFILLLRLTFLSRSYFLQAETLWKTGQFEESLETYTWAIRNHFPGNPYSGRALEEVIQVTDQLQKNGQTSQYKHALLDLRATLYSIRSGYQPFRSQLEQIEQQLKTMTDLE